MSYTIISRLKTSDITNIIGEFNQSIRVFDEKRYNKARKSGSLYYYDELIKIFTREDARAQSTVKNWRCRFEDIALYISLFPDNTLRDAMGFYGFDSYYGLTRALL